MIEKSADATPPSSTMLFPHKFATNSLTILWDHATDNVGVYEYKLERNGALIASLDFPSFVYTDKGLTPDTIYTYTIQAIDEAGNVSTKSNQLTVKTLPGVGSILTTSESSVPSGWASSTNIQANNSSPSSSLRSSSSHSNPLQSSSSHSNPLHGSSSHNDSSRSLASYSSSSRFSSLQQVSSSRGSASAMSSSSHSNSSFQQSSSRVSSSATVSSSLASSSSSSRPTTVHLKWEHPRERANGEYLELKDIAGYELHRRNNRDTPFLVIEGNSQTEYVIKDLREGEEIYIAVFDTNGLYSDFVRLFPR